MTWIYGAGGFGRETLDACRAAEIEVHGFVDDALAGGEVRGLPIRSRGEVEPSPFVVAIADTTTRARLHRSLVDDGWEPVTVLDPRAVVGSAAAIGPGSVVLATAFVSCDVTLGEGTHLNYGVTIGHDVDAADFTTVLPGANVGGSVRLAEGVLVGSGSQILQGLTLGTGAVVGAGAVVTGDVAAARTVVGVPARHRP